MKLSKHMKIFRVLLLYIISFNSFSFKGDSYIDKFGSCAAWNGEIIKVLPNYYILEPAAAVILANDRVPSIIINPNIYNHMPSAVQVFTYYHECAHIYFRHIGRHRDNELQADFAAIHYLVDNKFISGRDFNEIYNYFTDPSMLSLIESLTGQQRANELVRSIRSKVRNFNVNTIGGFIYGKNTQSYNVLKDGIVW